MPTLARFPAREASLQRQARLQAFTLIELLTVIAIIGILSAIALGVIKGVKERAAVGQAKAELASLSLALEAYKKQYGDYPQTTDPAVFLQSLLGKKGPQGATITSGKVFTEVAKFNLSDPKADPATTTDVYLVDPWGQAYCYFYKASTAWTNPGYILVSAGPDGYIYETTVVASTVEYTALLDTTGTLKAEDSGSADNIYANK